MTFINTSNILCTHYHMDNFVYNIFFKCDCVWAISNFHFCHLKNLITVHRLLVISLDQFVANTPLKALRFQIQFIFISMIKLKNIGRLIKTLLINKKKNIILIRLNGFGVTTSRLSEENKRKEYSLI